MQFPKFQFDRISFFLGFLAATLAWWLISRFRPYIPVYWGMVKRYLNELNEQNQAGAEQMLRREMVRRFQRNHVAAPIFAMDELLIEPRVIAPPPLPTPGAPPNESEAIALKVVPYVPDWPELVSPLGYPTLTLAQALQNGCHIALIGQPGSGKSVALGHLAAQISRNEEKVGELRNVVPMLIHIIDLESTISSNSDPIQGLIKAVASQVNVVAQPQLIRYLNIVIRDKNRKSLLMLDGLDELPQEGLTSVVNFLKTLIERIPNLQVVVTASSEYLDGLVALGFYPLGIAAWTQAQRCEFIQKWGTLWAGQFMPDVKKNFQAPDIDPMLINNWLINDLSTESPFELTLKTWSAYAGDLNGSSLSGAMANYFSRYMPMKKLLPAIDILAHQLVRQGKYWMDIDTIEEILSAYQPPEDAAPAPENLPGGEDPGAAKKAKAKSAKKKQSDRDAIVTQGERVITALTGSGILSQHAGSRIRFSHPLFTGYLASSRVKPEEASEMAKKLDWVINVQALRFLAASSPNPSWIFQILEDLRAPLYPSLMMVARWLADAPASNEWRTHVMHNMAQILQNDAIPLGTRAKVAAAFLTSRDSATPRLFKQLLSHQSFYVRQIAILGCGALANPHYLTDILETLIDPEASVRTAACLALSAIPGDTALSGLVEILMQGDEDIRQAAAEALALNHMEGKQVLEELVGVEDLLTRRATVFGLVQIREEWSRKLLEKIAVEDGQWVVRNAASHALAEFQKPNSAIPSPLPPPSENAWMLTFASKLGMGIRPGHPATDVLLAALKSGSLEEQILAMMYLRTEPSEGVVAVLYNALYSDQSRLHEPSLTTLWLMMLSGFKLPSPTQFGLG